MNHPSRQHNHVPHDDPETLEAATIFGHAAHFFNAAADMILKGAPYRDPAGAPCRAGPDESAGAWRWAAV